jgi:hypothetical protein
MARMSRRFSIYDVMEEKGVFEANPANINSRDNENGSLYKGPVEYPKMLYHPLAEMEVVVPGQWEQTPLGPKYLNEQQGIKFKIAKDKEEERQLRAEGWTDHPSKSIEQANKVRADKGQELLPVPSMGAEVTAKKLELERDAIQAKLDELLADNASLRELVKVQSQAKPK